MALPYEAGFAPGTIVVKTDERCGFVSRGGIRTYSSEIRELYRLVSPGTPMIVEQ